MGYVNPKELSSTIYDEIINSKIEEVVGPIKIRMKQVFIILIRLTQIFFLLTEDIKNTIYKNKSIKLDSWFGNSRKVCTFLKDYRSFLYMKSKGRQLQKILVAKNIINSPDW